MKNPFTTLSIIAGLTLAAHAAAPALEDINQELALTRARLELAEAKLALAARDAELERTVRPAAPGEDIRFIEAAPRDSARLPAVRGSARTQLALRNREMLEWAKPIAGEALRETGRIELESLSNVQTQFLMNRLGRQDDSNRLRVEIGLAKKKADGTATATDAAVAEDEGVDQTGEQTGDTVKKLFAGIDDAVFFRNAGISFSVGYGVVMQGGNDHDVGTVLARWNLRQAEATYWYNNLTAHGKDEGYNPVPYYGKNRMQFVDWYEKARGHPMSDRQSWLTAWGPFIGSTAAGEKLDSGSGEERPYLAGLSFGFGFSTEAASLFYIDVGTTISPKQGFKSNKLYVGISADAALLPAIWDKIRGGK